MSSRDGLYVCDIEHNLRTVKPFYELFIPIPLEQTHYAIGFRYMNFWNGIFQEIVKRLINGGIVNKLLEVMFQCDFKDLVSFEEKEVLLTYNDLRFLLFVCLFGYSVGFLAYLIEHAVHKVEINIKRKKLIDYGTPLDTEFINMDEIDLISGRGQFISLD